VQYHIQSHQWHHEAHCDTFSSRPSSLFPNEIWAIVFKHIDKFTLWTTCRALSQDLRAEAEREMRVARLPELCIERNSNCPHNLELGIPWVMGILETTGLLRFSDDTALAHFRLAFQVQQGFRPVSSTGRWFKDGCSSTEANLHRFRGPLLESLHSSDLNLLRQMEDSNRWQNTSGELCPVADVYIGSLIVNSVDVPWKDINFAEEEISID
jgi:hypothetical protein